MYNKQIKSRTTAFGKLCLSEGLLIGPNRYLAQIHNDSLIRKSNME